MIAAAIPIDLLSVQRQHVFHQKTIMGVEAVQREAREKTMHRKQDPDEDGQKDWSASGLGEGTVR